jgi:hypothetical protein
MHAEPKAVDWANEQFFYPDKAVDQAELQVLLDALQPGRKVLENGILNSTTVVKYLQEAGFKVKKLAEVKDSVSRKELARWIDRALDK